jgi:hypothetical protein
MGRTSGRKPERGIADLAATAAGIRRASEPGEAPTDAPAPPAAAPSPSAGRRGTRQAVGARVARVAVDDETWAAFRDLCGATPASIRLGGLVAAEVERSRKPGNEPDPVAAVQAIRSQLDELEALMRRAARST